MRFETMNEKPKKEILLKCVVVKHKPRIRVIDKWASRLLVYPHLIKELKEKLACAKKERDIYVT